MKQPVLKADLGFTIKEYPVVTMSWNNLGQLSYVQVIALDDKYTFAWNEEENCFTNSHGNIKAELKL